MLFPHDKQYFTSEIGKIQKRQHQFCIIHVQINKDKEEKEPLKDHPFPSSYFVDNLINATKLHGKLVWI